MRFEAHVGQHLATWRVGVNPKESVSCHRALGGGVLRELSHEIDYSLWICGAPEKVRARSSRYLKYGDAEDSADIWMDLPGGVHAAIHMDMNDRMPRRNIRAICENGTIELDFLNSSLLVNVQLRSGKKLHRSLTRTSWRLKTFFREVLKTLVPPVKKPLQSLM